MAEIKFDENTDYDNVELVCWEMMSAIEAKKCGCKKCNSSEMCRVNSLLYIALNYEKVRRPDRYVRSMKTIYYLLLAIK